MTGKKFWVILLWGMVMLSPRGWASNSPEVHQASWFYLVCALVIVSIGFIGYRLRIRQLRKRAEELHSLVEERTRDLRERNEELEAIEQTIKTINLETRLEKVLHSILQSTLAFFPQTDKGGFLMFDEQEQVFRPFVFKGYSTLPEQTITFTYREAVGRYIESAEPIEEGIYILRKFHDIPAEEKVDSLPKSRSILVMSLIVEGQVVGFHILENVSDPQAFDRSNIHMLSRIREHAVSAVSKARTLEQLKREKERAEKASKAKSEFLAQMSHEIRTPMNAILGYTEILEGEITDEKFKRYLKTISSSGSTLLGVINDILDLSRIEAGKVEFNYGPVNPRSVLNEINQLFYHKVKDKGLDFRLEVDPDLPRALSMDGLRIRQVLLNLVGNALKFTDKGYITLSVHHTPHGEVDLDGTGVADLVFSVRDTGIGIPKNQQESIFEAFKQQEGQDLSLYGGSGLGLSIALRLVEMMGGEITVQSEEGKGSTFLVSLKNVKTFPGGEEPDIEFKPDVRDIRFEKALILVADDNESNRRLLTDYLVGTRIDCLEADNGREAINMVRQYRPDLALMDKKMPVMDGCEATRVLKADEELKSIPVIIVTASALKEQWPEIQQSGCDGHLNKPVGKSDLFIELMRYLPYFTCAGTGTSAGPTETMEAKTSPTAREIEEGAPTVEFQSKLPELLAVLRGDGVTHRLERLKKTLIFDELEDFSGEMKTLGQTYRAGVLEDWAKRLSRDTQTFNLVRIQETLSGFPRVITEIERQEDHHE